MSTVEMVPLETVFSVRNPRKTLGDITELAASIQQHGILQPLGVRIATVDGLEGLQLVFGQRRLAAARHLGLKEVPCVVLQLSDEEADEAGIIENLQRTDIPPLEEADAFTALLERNPLLTIEELALRVGKPVSTVRLRLALSMLCDVAREALTAGKLTLGAAQELARVENVETQATLTRELLDDWRVQQHGEQVTRTNARQAVMKHAHPLSRAPFDLADAGLVPAAGACTYCPKRTNAQGALFGLAADAEDRCMAAACWAEKVQAHNARTAEAAKARGVKVLTGEQAKVITPAPGCLATGWMRLSDRVPLPHPDADGVREPEDDPNKTDEENQATQDAYWKQRDARIEQWHRDQQAQPTYAAQLTALGVDHLVDRVVVELDGVACEVARKQHVLDALKAANGGEASREEPQDEEPQQPRKKADDKRAQRMTASVESLAPWSTADEPTRRHLALVRARWDLRMSTTALELAERFRRQALEQLAAGEAAEDAVMQSQVLVEECRADVELARAVERKVTALVLQVDGPAGTHGAAMAAVEVVHAHQA